ncbi:MAG: hypothetical protein AAFZ15_08635 [Bacteroidota bacterium]
MKNADQLELAHELLKPTKLALHFFFDDELIEAQKDYFEQHLKESMKCEFEQARFPLPIEERLERDLTRNYKGYRELISHNHFINSQQWKEKIFSIVNWKYKLVAPPQIEWADKVYGNVLSPAIVKKNLIDKALMRIEKLQHITHKLEYEILEDETLHDIHKFNIQKRLPSVLGFLDNIEKDLKEGNFTPCLWTDFYFNYESSDKGKWFEGFRGFHNLKKNVKNAKTAEEFSMLDQPEFALMIYYRQSWNEMKSFESKRNAIEFAEKFIKNGEKRSGIKFYGFLNDYKNRKSHLEKSDINIKRHNSIIRFLNEEKFPIARKKAIQNLKLLGG